MLNFVVDQRRAVSETNRFHISGQLCQRDASREWVGRETVGTLRGFGTTVQHRVAGKQGFGRLVSSAMARACGPGCESPASR